MSMHLLIIRLQMLTQKLLLLLILLLGSIVVCQMCNICPFCHLTFQTEPQTPSTGTQTGAASMPSVTNLTVIWRGERKTSGRSTHTSCLALLLLIVCGLQCFGYSLWFLTSIPGLSWPPDCWPTRFSLHRSGRPCKRCW